jgi:hypothetical protein
MPGISVDTLAGYILEELIAYLIRNTGYRLLVDASQDPHELKNESNGLNIIGRGALHQVDVLGELSWIPAFTFPLRLVIEAKCRKTKAGIDVTRALMATLTDVNQNHSLTRRQDPASPPRPKYMYVGAVFSASGFSSRAADLALAHGISLVDLNTTEFKPLVDAARASAAALVGKDPESEEGVVDQHEISGNRFIRAVRIALRQRLRTLPEDFYSRQTDAAPDTMSALDAAIKVAQAVGELFAGMAAGPYLLLLKADNRDRFVEYATKYPSHPISIEWSKRVEEGQTWYIAPRDDPAAYRLSFRLPEQIGSWIFRSANLRRAALAAKQDFFSTISIYRREPDRDLLIRLSFQPDDVSKAFSLSSSE